MTQIHRVYRVEGEGHYAGGMAVVAAVSTEDAMAVVNSHPDRDKYWSVNFAKCEMLPELSYTGKTSKVLAFYELGE